MVLHGESYFTVASPHREGKSKRFSQKVMFLAAVARPRYDEDGDLIFDGKLGIWPFVQLIPAKQISKNRPKGTSVQYLLAVAASKVWECGKKTKIPPCSSVRKDSNEIFWFTSR